MTEFIEIQIKVCEDLVRRMEEAIRQNHEVQFNSEKQKLIDVLSNLRTADPAMYEKYSKYTSMMFCK